MVFWRTACVRRGGWWLHLLFFPTMLLLEWELLRLAAALNDDGDGPPGTGFLYAPGLLSTLGVGIAYAVSLIVAAGRMTLRRLRQG